MSSAIPAKGEHPLRLLVKVVRAAMFVLLLPGCGFVHDETLVARYRLVAVDVDEDLMLCWSLDSGDCVGDGLPGPSLFAAGFNDKYVVAAVHHARKHPSYYYVIRDPANEDKDSGLPYQGVKGPFNEAEFAAERARLGLPAFSRVFNDLK